MLATCKAKNKDGTPCSAAVARDGYCVWHAPGLAEQRQEWRAKGGQQRSNKARARKALPAELMNMAEVQSYLGITLRGVLSGKIEPGVGNSVANPTRAFKDVAGAAELEERIAELEQRINARGIA